jgi:hypothetical protein
MSQWRYFCFLTSFRVLYYTPLLLSPSSFPPLFVVDIHIQGYDSGVGNNMGDAELYPYNANRPRRTGLMYLR